MSAARCWVGGGDGGAGGGGALDARCYRSCPAAACYARSCRTECLNGNALTTVASGALVDFLVAATLDPGTASKLMTTVVALIIR